MQDEIAILFEKSVTVISRHIANIFKDGELEKDTSLQKMQKSPNAKKIKQSATNYYNLDIIISATLTDNSEILTTYKTSICMVFVIKSFLGNDSK